MLRAVVLLHFAGTEGKSFVAKCVMEQEGKVSWLGVS